MTTRWPKNLKNPYRREENPTMTRAELIDLLVHRRLDAENAKRSANLSESVTGWMLEQGRLHEIDYMLNILRTNLINGD